MNAEEVNDRAKLIMHRLVARRLATDPGIIERARNVLDWKRQRLDLDCYAEWERLLDLGAEEVRRRIVQRSEEMTRLRLSSPLGLVDGAFFDIDLRRRIWRKAKLGARRP